MISRHTLFRSAALFLPGLFGARSAPPPPPPPEPLVRLAELEIDPAQIAPYKAALREEIEASLRLEPGVLTLYAVAIKDHPEQVRLFEMYAGMDAYRSHLESPHFRKYKAATAGMVKSLRLLETAPILLGARPSAGC